MGCLALCTWPLLSRFREAFLSQTSGSQLGRTVPQGPWDLGYNVSPPSPTPKGCWAGPSGPEAAGDPTSGDPPLDLASEEEEVAASSLHLAL
jgi:hypothetical protein